MSDDYASVLVEAAARAVANALSQLREEVARRMVAHGLSEKDGWHIAWTDDRQGAIGMHPYRPMVIQERVTWTVQFMPARLVGGEAEVRPDLGMRATIPLLLFPPGYRDASTVVSGAEALGPVRFPESLEGIHESP